MGDTLPQLPLNKCADHTVTAPKGTPSKMRPLPYYENPNAYHVYRVIKPIENVEAGTIAPAFDEPGGGVQYRLPSVFGKIKVEQKSAKM